MREAPGQKWPLVRSSMMISLWPEIKSPQACRTSADGSLTYGIHWIHLKSQQKRIHTINRTSNIWGGHFQTTCEYCECALGENQLYESKNQLIIVCWRLPKHSSRCYEHKWKIWSGICTVYLPIQHHPALLCHTLQLKLMQLTVGRMCFTVGWDLNWL